MSVISFIQIILVVVNGYLLISTVEAEPIDLDANAITLADQYLRESLKDIPEEAANPPRNRNSSIQYLLFTPDHPDTPCYLESNMEALKRCPFDPTYPMKIVIHGFIVMLTPGNPFFKIKDKMLESYKYNVIILDWTKYNQPPYPAAAVNTIKIGDELAALIRFLEKTKGVDPRNIHLIGHSLGAHISGVTGAQIPNLSRITGLDPAARIFYPYTYLHRLSESDADFVDIIHSSNRTLGYGIEDPIGDVDFYPNGGESQPKCQMIGEKMESEEDVTALLKSKACNHKASILYFLHSIDTKECVFIATKCDSFSDFQDGICSSDSSAKDKMGLPAVPVPGLPPKSKFYLKTSASPPYCLEDGADPQ